MIKNCLVCGAAFDAIRSALTCSASCRLENNRALKRRYAASDKCRAKARLWNAAHQDRIKSRRRKVLDARRSAGQCKACGRQRLSQRALCERCTVKRRTRRRSEATCPHCQRQFIRTAQQQTCCSQQCSRQRKLQLNRERLCCQRVKDRERFLRYARQDYRRHREARLGAARKWQLANPAKRREIAQGWITRYPGRRAASVTAYNRSDKGWLSQVRRDFKGALPEPQVIEMLRELRRLRDEVNR